MHITFDKTILCKGNNEINCSKIKTYFPKNVGQKRVIVSMVSVAGMSFIAFHFMAMTKTNKFNDGEFQQVVVLSVGT